MNYSAPAVYPNSSQTIHQLVSSTAETNLGYLTSYRSSFISRCVELRAAKHPLRGVEISSFGNSNPRELTLNSTGTMQRQTVARQIFRYFLVGLDVVGPPGTVAYFVCPHILIFVSCFLPRSNNPILHPKNHPIAARHRLLPVRGDAAAR